MEKGKKTCMADNNDVRWLQRYDSFRKALDRLESVTLSGRHPSDLSELEKSGLVQWFEFTYELAAADLLKDGYERAVSRKNVWQKRFLPLIFA